MKFNYKPTRIESFFYAILFQFVLFGLYFAHNNNEYFESVFVVEDGLVEWLTVCWLMATAFLCLKRFVTLQGKRPKFFLAMLLVFSALFIFGAGEEISWGQRIFNVQSSDFFQTHNAQGETNLHNLVVSGKKINKMIFGVALGIIIGIYTLLLPTLARKYKPVMKLVQKFAVPIPRGRHVLAYLLLFLFVEINPSAKRGELIEFGGTLIFFLIFFNPWNRRAFTIEQNQGYRPHHGQRNNHRRNNNYRGKKPNNHQRHHNKPAES